MRRKLATWLFAAVLALAAAPPVWADSPPPPAPGNGAGNSEQCTGPQDERPASCTSQGGPGDQP
jgi:hypothetical protein